MGNQAARCISSRDDSACTTIEKGHSGMRLYKVVRIAILALCTALIAVGSAAAGPAQAPPSPAGADWSSHGGDLFNQRYSALDQINKTNVKDLKGAWFFHIDYGEQASSFESTPIVIGGVMYVTSGRADVWALDAKTGTKKWEYHPDLTNLGEPDVKVCCGVVNRGVAVGSGKVF